MKHPANRRKRILIAGSIFTMLLISYTTVFARQLRCQFVAWSDLRQVNSTLYVDPRMPEGEIRRIETMIAEARKRDAQLLDGLRSSPVIIAGTDEQVIGNYGSEGNRTAVTHLYFGHASIVLGPNGLNTDVIAHEMMHAELSERVGWLRREMELPIWFDEGLAMQADYRAEYSEKEWQKRTDGGKLAPALSTLESRDRFASDDYWRSYATSKHEVMRWHAIVGKEGLLNLLERVERGEDFATAYSDIEKASALRRAD